DSDERLFFFEFGQQRDEPIGFEPLHRIGKVADAREDEDIRPAEHIRILRQLHPVAEEFQCTPDVRDIAEAVVDDGDAASIRQFCSSCFTSVHARSPFVEASRPSPGCIASRSARANDLKNDSISWWALPPRIRSMWTVSPAFITRPRKNSSVSSVSNVPTFSREISALKLRYGRPLISMTVRVSVSSIGT